MTSCQGLGCRISSRLSIQYCQKHAGERLQRDDATKPERGPHQATDRVRVDGIFRIQGRYNRSLLFFAWLQRCNAPYSMLTID